METGQSEEKKLTIQFSSTEEMTAKTAIKLLLDTYNTESEEVYQEAQ